ncbi:MAG TPA: 30S ribosomal protein S17 [Candidatus Riflebacteria bacterium]|jgi:small subunit ribosomal protein S17|nr:ribosomal protein S17 [uncultured bacterium]PKL40956.1 MAG: 30S ribosomal protein S17 [Candidatus Riflebacteria bacterium HGW-Riflebacteria-1]HAE37859.1 30S ribosomal protein S17 [Candidatus Riflebacteria bacterium]
MENTKVVKRSRVAKVIADSTEKTIKVEIEGIVQHPRYKKYIKRHTRFLVHDPEEKCKVGDLVRIEECRPVSKTKKWIVREIVKTADSVAE